MYTFYILFSKIKTKYYIGYTGDLIEERVRKHNSKHKGFTGKVCDWEIVYKEMYSSKQKAYKREREVKSWKSRFKIEALISNFS